MTHQLVDKKAIERDSVMVEASPAFAGSKEITPLGIYEAIREVIEYTYIETQSAASGQSWKTEYKTQDIRYFVVDDLNEPNSFGGECFRII